MSRFAFALSVLVLLAGGILAFAIDWNGATPESGSEVAVLERDDEAVSRLARRVDQLTWRLDEEIARREALEETLAGLASDRVANSAGQPERDVGAAGSPGFGRSGGSPEGRPAWPAPGVRGLDPEVLVGAGFPRRDVPDRASSPTVLLLSAQSTDVRFSPK